MGFHLLRYVLVRRRPILLVTLAFLVLSALYVLIADRTYESKALLLPPLEEGSEGLLSAWMAQLNLPSVVVPATGGATTAAILADIIESRRLGEMIIRKLDLMTRYDTGTMDEAVGKLRSRTGVSITKTGLIRLNVLDEEPREAMRIAELYIEGLDSLNHYLQFSRAASTLDFISGQIERYRRQLAQVRENIARFQHEHGIIDFKEQVRGAIDVASEVKVRVTIAKIELGLLKEFSREDALELRRKETEYRNLLRELNKIMEGDTSETVFVPLRSLPDLYQRYAGMQRDLEVNERVYSFLLERYEETGINKTRNTPTVQVVDSPSLPEKASGLPRWAVVCIVTIAGFAWSVAVVAWWGWLSSRKRDEDESSTLKEIGEIVRSDLEYIRRTLRL